MVDNCGFFTIRPPAIIVDLLQVIKRQTRLGTDEDGDGCDDNNKVLTMMMITNEVNDGQNGDDRCNIYMTVCEFT